MDAKTALETIMKSQDAKALKWAISYTRFALEMINANAQPNYIAGQLLYVQNNITYWRHPQAKEVRAAIKQYITKHLG